MKTKLTLRLDVDLIARAKEHARTTGRSISDLVADFFAGLEQARGRDGSPPPADGPPHTAALVGLLEGAELHEDDLVSHLERKHG